MLTGYYHSIGLYPTSSSLENEENEEFEGESSLSNELSDCSDVSANSSPTAHDRIATPVIDVRQYLVASTSDFEGVDSISTDMDMWSSSVSSMSPSSHHLHHLCVQQNQHIQITYYYLMLIY